MLGGPGNRVDDKPGWREKLADWRDSPLWVWQRPSWMTEGPGVLLLLFGGIASLMLAFAYVAVPPETLPDGVPGHFSVQAAAAAVTTTTSTSTTTTTLPAKKVYEQSIRRRLRAEAMTEAQKQQYFEWVTAAAAFEESEREIAELLASPVKPPFRRFDIAFGALVIGAVMLGSAWYLSEARQRRVWSDG
jgi:hypothetical protein